MTIITTAAFLIGRRLLLGDGRPCHRYACRVFLLLFPLLLQLRAIVENFFEPPNNVAETQHAILGLSELVKTVASGAFRSVIVVVAARSVPKPADEVRELAEFDVAEAIQCLF